MSRSRKSLGTVMFILLVPWLVRTPRHLQKQIGNLHVGQTWDLSRTERRVHFLQVQMDALETDYFGLLQAAALHFANRPLSYELVVTDRLLADAVANRTQRAIARAFSVYWLCPARLCTPEETPGYVLYYRCEPVSVGGRIVACIPGAKPSYVVEVEP